MKELIDLPLVQLGDKASLRVGSVEDADKVCKDGFPDAQLKLVKEIHNKHVRRVEVTTQAVRERVLEQTMSENQSRMKFRRPTLVGTAENGFKMASTAFPAIGRARS